jgi:hypothetical protein
MPAAHAHGFAGGRAWYLAPVVEHLGDVHHRARSLGDPEQQVVVLGAVVAGTEAACVDDHGAAQHREVGEVVVVAQPLR